jgi:hypothetical protein
VFGHGCHTTVAHRSIASYNTTICYWQKVLFINTSVTSAIATALPRVRLDDHLYLDDADDSETPDNQESPSLTKQCAQNIQTEGSGQYTLVQFLFCFCVLAWAKGA